LGPASGALPLVMLRRLLFASSLAGTFFLPVPQRVIGSSFDPRWPFFFRFQGHPDTPCSRTLFSRFLSAFFCFRSGPCFCLEKECGVLTCFFPFLRCCQARGHVLSFGGFAESGTRPTGEFSVSAIPFASQFFLQIQHRA